MSQVTIKQLLEAGVHFGHQTQRWNPKMKKYIFGERNGIYIINLELTLSCLDKAMAFLRQTSSEGREVLLVGTKKQAQDPIREAGEKSGMPYVNQRWLGGMLTNFETVRKSVARLELIDRMEKDGSFAFVTKKEVGMLKKEREKLVKNLAGVRNMKRLPSVLFVIDSKKEEIAIHEAVKLGIPVVAVLDTNCDPDKVDYPLPGNDDAIRAVKLFCELAGEAVRQGREQFANAAAAAAAEEEAALAAEAAADQSAVAEVAEEIEEKIVSRLAVEESEADKKKKPVRKDSLRTKK